MLVNEPPEIERDVKVEDIRSLAITLDQLDFVAERLQRLVHADVELVLVDTMKDQHAKLVTAQQTEIGHLRLHVFEIDEDVGQHQVGDRTSMRR